MGCAGGVEERGEREWLGEWKVVLLGAAWLRASLWKILGGHEKSELISEDSFLLCGTGETQTLQAYWRGQESADGKLGKGQEKCGWEKTYTTKGTGRAELKKESAKWGTMKELHC